MKNIRRVAGIDMDLTLTTAEAGDYHLRCFDKALKKVLDIDVNTLEETDFRGKTDFGLMMEVAKMKNKLEEFMEKKEEIRAALKYFFEKDFDKQEIRLMPGAMEFLEYLSGETDTIVTPMTGNSKYIAIAKMRRLGVEKFFVPDIGGYGDGFEERKDIVKDMVRKSEEYVRKTDGRTAEVFVIDDAPRGIKAAVEGGAKGIVVMGGYYKDPKMFREYKPVAILNSLEQLDKLKKIFPAVVA